MIYHQPKRRSCPLPPSFPPNLTPQPASKMNLRQTYVSHLLGWCLLSLLQTPVFQFGPRAHELWCDKQHVAPYTAHRLVPMCLLTLGLGSGDAETNKVYPKHIHSTGDTLPNTTWPHRTHLGLHDCINLLLLFFFQFFCLPLNLNYHAILHLCQFNLPGCRLKIHTAWDSHAHPGVHH